MSFGHIFAGLLLKLKPKKLSIMPFGLAVTFESYEYKKLIETKKIIIAFAGPLTNILISIGLLFIHMDQDLKQIMIYSNILVALFNLIPIYPLDGGRILKGLIRKKYDDNIKSDILVNKISNILYPILGKIFKDIPKNHESLGYISSNIAANILGLGSAATPFGLKAMKSLQELNDNKDTASHSMITFLLLNTVA